MQLNMLKIPVTKRRLLKIIDKMIEDGYTFPRNDIDYYRGEWGKSKLSRTLSGCEPFIKHDYHILYVYKDGDIVGKIDIECGCLGCSILPSIPVVKTTGDFNYSFSGLETPFLYYLVNLNIIGIGLGAMFFLLSIAIGILSIPIGIFAMFPLSLLFRTS